MDRKCDLLWKESLIGIDLRVETDVDMESKFKIPLKKDTFFRLMTVFCGLFVIMISK